MNMEKQRRRGRNPGGFTLVEMLVAMGMASVVMVAVLTLFTTSNRSYVKQGKVVSSEQNVRSALEIMGHEFRMAGYIPLVNMPGGTNAIANGVSGAPLQKIVNATVNDITFVGDVDSSGSLQTVRYWLNATTLQRQTWQWVAASSSWVDPIPGPVTIAENITALTFSYDLSDGRTGVIPAATDLDLIRAITIQMTGRTSITFENAQYITRTLTSRIKLRNMGLDTTIR